MKIDRAGFPFIAAAIAPAAFAGAFGLRKTSLGLSTVAIGVTAFFRDPQRRPDGGSEYDADVVVAPADGRVMHAGPAEPGVAPPGDWQQISIFLGLNNVHMNRTPYGGTVTTVTYHPGRYLAAFSPASAIENERSEITVVREVGGQTRTVVFRQIVGLLARRVVTRVEAGDTVTTGQRIGLMKFGSRMDIFLPPDVALLVTKGTRVVAGESAIARWRSTEPAGAAR